MNHFPVATRMASSMAVLAVTLALSSSRAAMPQSAGDPQNGKRIFERLGCLRCHGSAGEGMSTTGREDGPPKIAVTHLSLRDFVESIRKPKGQMPPFSSKQATDKELSDVYAFLQSVTSQPKLEFPSSANAQNGQSLYTALGCYECHGYQDQGSVQTGGSRIGPPQIPYSGFVAYVRQPTGQMPPYTSGALSDAQLADIYAFLKSRPQAVPSKNISQLNQ